MLAAGTAAQASFSALTIGLPVLAPALREAYRLDLSQIGVVLASEWVGTLATLLLWGIAADRVGERAVLAAGLAGCALFLAAAAYAPGFLSLVALLALAGAAGASVQSASGRAVMHWFAPAQRGLAFGVRQTAVTIGGVIGALVLPPLAARGGVDAAFLFLAGFCVVAALGAVVVIRDAPSRAGEHEAVPWTLRDRRLWTLCGASGFYVATQIALLSFLVLYLHDERAFSERAAAGALAVVAALATALRLAAGRWSDVVGSRVGPLRRIGLGVAATLAAAAVLLDRRAVLVLPLLLAAGALSSAWNGLSFVAAAELAGAARSGAAIGFQQTVLSFAGIVVPPAFAVLVAQSSWRVGFGVAALSPLVGWVMLGRLRV